MGKELALDIVQLNKKIDLRSGHQQSKVKILEANLEKLDKKTNRILKQNNIITHQMRKLETSFNVPSERREKSVTSGVQKKTTTEGYSYHSVVKRSPQRLRESS